MNYFKKRAGETTTWTGLILMVVTVGLQLVTAFGVDITAEQHAAILATASVVIALVLMAWPDKKEKKCDDNSQHF